MASQGSKGTRTTGAARTPSQTPVNTSCQCGCCHNQPQPQPQLQFQPQPTTAITTTTTTTTIPATANHSHNHNHKQGQARPPPHPAPPLRRHLCSGAFSQCLVDVACSAPVSAHLPVLRDWRLVHEHSDLGAGPALRPDRLSPSFSLLLPRDTPPPHPAHSWLCVSPTS